MIVSRVSGEPCFDWKLANSNPNTGDPLLDEGLAFAAPPLRLE